MPIAAAGKRRRGEEETRRPKKRIRNFKKQAEYHSSSEDEDVDRGTGANATVPIPSRPKPILKRNTVPAEERVKPRKAQDDDKDSDDFGNFGEADHTTEATEDDEAEALDNFDAEIEEGVSEGDAADGDGEALEAASAVDTEQDSESDASDSDLSTTASSTARAKKKRNDPDAFATSISKILDTKLTTTKRQDPVLSRSKDAAAANRSLADSRLEAKAKSQLRTEKRTVMDKGRVKDVLALDDPTVDTAAMLELENRLKKTAQRGVVRLFNAVRMAQVKAEKALEEARRGGVVGMKQREERVTEMSKQGFLDLIAGGGKGPTALA